MTHRHTLHTTKVLYRVSTLLSWTLITQYEVCRPSNYLTSAEHQNDVRLTSDLLHLLEGAFKYYIIRLGGGGLDKIDDFDDASRGGGGSGT